MGVPAFFRWLTVRYPKVVVDALSEEDLEDLETEYRTKKDPNEVDLDEALVQATRLNQAQKLRQNIAEKIAANNPEIDNLYLDMNGIIHPCAHPQNGGPQPQSENEIFNNIYAYTDKVIRLVKPKKLIYFAIDGVAPRAKMNQQRARRFRAARDAEEDTIRKAEIKAEWADKINFADANPNEFKFDSNVITPGTEFMHRLSIALKKYIIERANNDSEWKDLTLIFSDAFVPGEGEHKILDFIRSQRAQSNYNPNQRHCIYGADADLIMLGLSTHEAHFFVLREAVMQVKDKICFKCKEPGHMSFECGTDQVKDKTKLSRVVEFQFVKIAVVREYLALEFKDVELPFEYDFERVVDDFVFLCFLVGNDFLPHLPSLQIREGALDAILVIYKHILPQLTSYLTCEGKITYENADIIFRDISKLEEEQFRLNYQKQQRMKENQLRRGGYQRNQNPNSLGMIKQDDATMDQTATSTNYMESAKKLVREQLDKELGRADISEQEKTKLAQDLVAKEVKKIAEAKSSAQVEAYIDKVQLGVDGWKMRYYINKFLVTDPNDVPEFIDKIKQSYIEGLQWVFAYYYKGCESWDWYYPYHYAPFASDLIDCGRVQIEFKIGKPRRPFEQLMCVFPKQSCHALPKCYHWLMSDSKSPIIDFYPISFRLDVNGAAYAWMGVNLLPFIDQERLFKAMKIADDDMSKLTPSEKQRNKRSGDILLFFGKGESSALRRAIIAKGEEYTASFASRDEVAGMVIGCTNELKLGSPVIEDGEVLVKQNRVIIQSFLHPHYDKHETKILEGAVLPKREVEDFEIYQVERRFFQGENAIRMVENLLGIESRQPAYRYGYKNNHATFDKPSNQSGSQYLGKRGHEDYSGSQKYEPNTYQRQNRGQDSYQNESRSYNDQRQPQRHQESYGNSYQSSNQHGSWANQNAGYDQYQQNSHQQNHHYQQQYQSTNSYAGNQYDKYQQHQPTHYQNYQAAASHPYNQYQYQAVGYSQQFYPQQQSYSNQQNAYQHHGQYTGNNQHNQNRPVQSQPPRNQTWSLQDIISGSSAAQDPNQQPPGSNKDANPRTQNRFTGL